MRTRPLVLAAAILVGGVGIACGSTQAVPACAANPGASKSGGGRVASPQPQRPQPQPRPAPPAPKPTTPPPSPYRPPPPGGPTKPETNVRNQPRPTTARSRDDAARERARAESRRPNVRPAAEDYDDARATAPTRLSRGGAFTSPVTNIEYHYHDLGWYRQPGLIIDLYDPYDRFNYWYRPMSPYYGMQFVLAGDCDGKDEKVEQPINVNVTVDQDGKVTGEAPATPGSLVPPETMAAPGSAPG